MVILRFQSKKPRLILPKCLWEISLNKRHTAALAPGNPSTMLPNLLRLRKPQPKKPGCTWDVLKLVTNFNQSQNGFHHSSTLTGTSKDNLQNYLTVRFPKRQFRIEQLPLYRDGKLPCFKVLVDNAILDEFQDENFWPVGVKITKYHSNFKKN